MRLLALDTTSHGCSVAILDDRDIVAEINIEKKETHSKHVMDMIDGALRVSGLNAEDMDAFAVAKGPGSFTGLRIGMSTIKGLCVATGKPLVGVSSLESLALGATSFGLPVCPIIDARKNEVYLARYSFTNRMPQTLRAPCAVGPDTLCDGIETPTLFLGTGVDVFGDVIKMKLGDWAVFPDACFHQIRARHVAELGYRSFSRGSTDETVSLTPTYIRKSDAELNLKRAVASSSPD